MATLGLVLAALTACDNVDENERFSGPVDITPKKNVLIEDFTGQRCSNCPLAAEELKSIQAAFGPEHVIAVAIHGGALGVSEADRPTIGLANEQGEQLYTHWGVTDQPIGLVDRTEGLQSFTNWFGLAVKRLIMEPKAELTLQQPDYDPATRTLNLQVAATSRENLEARLQLWLTESNLVRLQTMPAEWGGGNNKEYVHNHVFRTAVNDLMGDELPLQAGQPHTLGYTCTLNEGWLPENMAVLAILYNEDEGVIQVAEQPILTTTTNQHP